MLSWGTGQSGCEPLSLRVQDSLPDPRGAGSRDPAGRVQSGTRSCSGTTAPSGPLAWGAGGGAAGWPLGAESPFRRRTRPGGQPARASRQLLCWPVPVLLLSPCGSRSYRVLQAGEALHRPWWVGSIQAPRVQPTRLSGWGCPRGPRGPVSQGPLGLATQLLPGPASRLESGPPPTPPWRQDTSKGCRGSVLASGPLSWCPSPAAWGPPHPRKPPPQGLRRRAQPAAASGAGEVLRGQTRPRGS